MVEQYFLHNTGSWNPGCNVIREELESVITHCLKLQLCIIPDQDAYNNRARWMFGLHKYRSESRSGGDICCYQRDSKRKHGIFDHSVPA